MLRNCELGFLSLSGSRGVTDRWLKPLAETSPTCSSTSGYAEDIECFDLDDIPDIGEKQAAIGDDESMGSSASSLSASLSISSPMDASRSRPIEALKSITDSGVSAATSLTYLDLSGSQRLSDRGLLQLSSLPSLEVARFDHCHEITGHGLSVLSSSHRLCTLSLAHCRRLADEGLTFIAHLLSLESLSLEGCRCLSDYAVASLADLYNLRRLDLSQCDLVTDSAIPYLGNLEELREVSLGWLRLFSDEGLQTLCHQLGRTKNLTRLNISRCNVSDRGIGHLIKLEALEDLDMSGCTNPSSQLLVSVLERLPRLTSMNVSHIPGVL